MVPLLVEDYDSALDSFEKLTNKLEDLGGEVRQSYLTNSGALRLGIREYVLPNGTLIQVQEIVNTSTDRAWVETFISVNSNKWVDIFDQIEEAARE